MIAATTISDRVCRFLKLVHATLDEIFEQSAYSRFLDRQGLQSSRAAYALFLQESETSRGRRARCC